MIEYRSYTSAYQLVRANPKAQGGEMVALVKAIEFERVQAEIDDAKK